MNERPSLLNWSVLMSMLLFGLAQASPAQLPSAQKVLDHWAEAVGGRERLDALDSFQANYDLKLFGMDGTINISNSVPGKQLTKMELGGIFNITNLVVGDRAWIKDQNAQVSEASGAGLADLITSAYFDHFMHLRSDASKTLAGVKIAAESSFYALTLTPIHGTETTFVIDPKTWLPLRQQSDSGSGDTSTVLYSDWKKHHGILFAQQIHQSSGDVTNDLKMTLTAIEVNPRWAMDPFKPLAEKKTSPVVLDAERAAAIPMRVHGVHILVDVMVNGEGPFVFAFDTGAGINVIDESLAKKLKLNIQGELAGGGFGENKAELQLATGVNLAMPGVEVKDQTIATLDIKNLLEPRLGTRIDGILGFGFISRFVTRVDYKNQQIGFYDANHFDYQGTGEIVAMEIENSTPYVDATICGYGRKPIRGRFLVDSGAGGPVAINGPFAESIRLASSMPKTVLSKGGFGVGGEVTSLVGRLQSLQIGNLVFHDPVADISQNKKGAGADKNRAGILGGGIFSRCVVYFDYPGKRLILEPQAGFDDHFWWTNSGLTLISGGRGNFHHLAITRVVANSPGAVAGLKEGDQLLEIDGESAELWTIGRLKELFQKQTRVVKLQVLRAGKKLQLSMKLEEII